MGVMKISYCLVLLLLTCSCAKEGSNEWASLSYGSIKCKASSGMVSNGC